MDYIDAIALWLGLVAVCYFIDLHIAEPFDDSRETQTNQTGD